MTEPDRGPHPHPGMPRWLKVSLIALAVIVLVFVLLSLLGVGPDHGPSRH